MQGKMIFFKWENNYKHYIAVWYEYRVLRERKSLITWSAQWIRMLKSNCFMYNNCFMIFKD